MEVTINSEDGKILVKVEGRIDTTTAAAFQKDLEPLFEGDATHIDFDCSGLDYTSSQGLRVFLMLQKSIKARGGRIVLRNMQPQVREVFDITGFSSIIEII